MPGPEAARKAEIAPDREDQITAVRLWLYAVAALVLAMIVVGGATRLTDSGLSITEWQPILGVIPPLTEADWHEAFAKYQQIPQYQLVNKGMSLDEFKFIYWWEWAHRFLGRFIGVAFALPFLWFWARRQLPKGLAPKLLGVLALGAIQGGVGWFMVMSGLVDRVDVSPYRLALHLIIALVILAWLVWLALDIKPAASSTRRSSVSPGLKHLAAGLVLLVLLQSLLGAFVAGHNAGLTYNTWPLMDGQFIPDGLGTMSPWYINLFENITTIQFNHRMGAYLLAVVAVIQYLWVARSVDDQRLVRSALLVLIGVFAQAALGIWTLLEVVPLWLGLAHQAGAAIVLIIAVRHLHMMSRASTAAANAAAATARPARASA